ncbi:MAG: SBBP repeat-containing protein [Acidobacteria bacterium]|nr:SBBP repeat-containing protein [Acidobacteriota bacterium]
MRKISVGISIWLSFVLLGAATQQPHAAENDRIQDGTRELSLAPLIEGELLWNTFLGCVAGDTGSSVAVDTSGNTYVTGTSMGTWGAPIRAHSGVQDAFVAKFDCGGSLLWNTFLGGENVDNGIGIAVDPNGDVYVTGSSYATWGSPIRPFPVGGGAFVAKLSGGGSLVWNTFLEYSDGGGVAVDTSGNVYVTGTSSYTWGSPIRAFSGNGDAYVAKLDGGGSLLWNTFLGSGGPDVSSGTDWGTGIACDGSGNAYVVGESRDPWGSPIQGFSGGFADAFVAKLSVSGSLLWNTFLGGGDWDAVRGIAVDGSGNTYVAGWSRSTWGSPTRAYAGGDQDAFAAKLDTGGNLIWNSFLGGILADGGTAIAVDGDGNSYVAGIGESSWGSPIRNFAGDTDAFAAKLDGSGLLLWNTFLGSNSNYAEDAAGIARGSSGHIYVFGNSQEPWGSPIAPYNIGSPDAFLAKLAGPQTPGSDVFISSIKARSAKPGSQATIYGGGFSKNARLNLVYFNGYRARVSSAKTTRLKVTIPTRLKKGIVDVYVVVDGITSNTVQFQVK